MSNLMKPMRVVVGISWSLCVVLLFVHLQRAFSAEPEYPRVRNIVLIHGAWADGFGWKKRLTTFLVWRWLQSQPRPRAGDVL